MLSVSDGTATSNPDVVNVYIGSPVPEPTPPPSPSSLSTSASDGSIMLNWKKPSDDGGAPIQDYIVEFKLNSQPSWNVFDDGTSTSTSTLITNLENDQEYDFRISSVNSAGIGETSTIITDTPKKSEIAEQPDVTESIPTITEPEPIPEPESIQNKISQIKEKVSEIKKLLEILRSLQ